MWNGYDDVEIHKPKNEYIPTEDDIYANGWNEEYFNRIIEDEHSYPLIPRAPLGSETEDERDKKNMIIQERWLRATGSYWANNKYARQFWAE